MAAIFDNLLEFKDEEQLENMLNNMDKALAIKLIRIAFDITTSRFTLEENHVIYKCLSKLKENENKTSDLRDDDHNGDLSGEVRS